MRQAIAILSQLHHLRAYIPGDILDDIVRRAREDLRQEVALALLEQGIDPLAPWPESEDLRPLLRALSRAVYRTARFLGWRKPRKGGWQSPHSALFPEEEGED